MGGGIGRKPAGERLRATRENGNVGSDSDKAGAERKIAPGQRLVRNQYAGGLARLEDAGDAVLDSLLHLRMPGIADMPQRGGKIGRADKHAVDTGGVGDIVKRLQPGNRFNLQQQADLLLGLVKIVGGPVPAAGAAYGRSDAANAIGRIARRTDEFRRLRAAFHHGDQQAARADVEQLLHKNRVAGRRPDHGLHSIRGDRLQLRHYERQIIGRMLRIDQQPVKAGTRTNLRCIGIGERRQKPICGWPAAMAVLKAFPFIVFRNPASGECHVNFAEITEIANYITAGRGLDRPNERAGKNHLPCLDALAIGRKALH